MSETKDAYIQDNHLKVNIANFKIVKDSKAKPDKGTYGDICIVEDLNGNKFAAKEIMKCKDKSYEKSVNEEISALIHCQCPSVIKLIGYSQVNFQGKKSCVIFTELGVNGSLRQYLNNNIDANDNDIRQIIIIGTIHAIKVMHSKNIIHLDIKPENIVLDENFEPKIIDFGTAHYLHSTNLVTNDIGTPKYMAPEIVKEVKCGKEADIYSFGILLYEIVTRITPYPNLNNKPTNVFLYKVANKGLRPKFPAKTEKWLKELIEQCWDDDPSKRPTADELYLKLAKNIEGPIQHFFSFEEEEEKNDHINKYFLTGVSIEKVIKYIQKLEDKDENDIKTKSKNLDNIRNDKQDCKDLEEQIEELQKQLSSYRENIKSLTQEKNDLQTEKNKLIVTLNLEKNRVYKLYYQNTILNKSNEKNEKLIISLTEENKKLKKVNEDLNDNHKTAIEAKEKFEKSHKEITENSQNREKALNDEIINLNQIINEIRIQNEKLINENGELLRILDQNKNEIKNLQKLNYQNELNKKESIEIQNQLAEENAGLKMEIKSLQSKKMFKAKTMPEKEEPPNKKNDNDDLYRTLFTVGLNSIDARSQLQFLSGIQKQLKNENYNRYFCNICSLLQYLISIKPPENDVKYLNIFFNNQNSLIENGFNDFNQVYLLSDAIEILFQYKRFLAPEFINIIMNFNTVIFEIKYPSANFKQIYDFIISEMKSVEISIHITEILETDNTFQNQKRINYLKIGSSVKKISNFSFHNCFQVKSIEFSKKLTEIGMSPFSFCKSIVKVVIPKHVTSIGKKAFYYCPSLKYVSIPDSVTNIGSECFAGDKQLEIVKMPKDIKMIKNSVFYNCSALKKITIPSSVISIEDNAFYNCSSLHKVHFEEIINEKNAFLDIQKSAFSKCTSLQKLIFPHKLHSICAESFKDCENLNYIEFKSEVYFIGENSFFGCPLKEILISEKNEKQFKEKNPKFKIVGFGRFSYI